MCFIIITLGTVLFIYMQKNNRDNDTNFNVLKKIDKLDLTQVKGTTEDNAIDENVTENNATEENVIEELTENEVTPVEDVLELTDSEVTSALEAVTAYYENSVFAGQVSEIVRITDVSEYESAVIPHRKKDLVIAFYVTISGNPKRMIVLTKDEGGEWEIINEGV